LTKKEFERLIIDIIFVWEHLRDIEENALSTFHRVSKSVVLVGNVLDLKGIPCNEESREIERYGVLYAIQLISFITLLRQKGITLEAFLRKHRDIIRGIDSEYIRRYVIGKYSDIIYP